jgi:DNA-binding LacI/PurR family transcriptional regulator
VPEPGTDHPTFQADGPTLNDVARVARVSRQTVSNVLNAPDRVRPGTAQRVQQAIEQLGYRPHRLARNLKTRASRMIGYEITRSRLGVLNPILDRFVHALVEAAENDGYHVLLFTPNEDGLVTAYDDLVGTRTVDGFVLSDIDYGDARAAALADRSVPFVTFGRPEISQPHPWVDVDGAAGTAAAVRHLAELGHERIAFVGSPRGSATGDRRAEGFTRTVRELGLPHDDALDLRLTDDSHTGAALDQLLDQHQPPTAVVCVSDADAIGVMRAAAARGLRIGHDLAVTGFDDSPLAPLLAPPLTSVRQPLEAVAQRIVANLTSTMLAGPDAEPAGELLAPELIVRASTRPD